MSLFNSYNVSAKRYARTFEVTTPYSFISTFYVMAPSTTGTQGQVLMYDTTQEDQVKIAASGTKAYQTAGFLMQDVKDLDGGNLKGYRNLNNSVVNLGDSVGVFQGEGIAFTKTYQGATSIGSRLRTSNDGRGFLEAFTAGDVADVIAVVEATTGSKTPSLEPQQYSTASGNDWIRIRVLGL